MDNTLVNNEVRIRLKEVVHELKKNGIIHGLADLADIFGYSNVAVVSHIINGAKPIPSSFLLRLEKLFPMVNIEYIENGTGEMLRKEEKTGNVASFTEESPNDLGANINHLMSIVNDYQRRLDEKEAQLTKMIDIIANQNKQ